MKNLFVLAMVLCLTSLSYAYEDDFEEGLNYDAIIKKLSQSENQVESTGSMLDDVKIHAGVGLANSLYNIKHRNGENTYAAQRGVEVALGIDLFSKYWVAEGSFRNYGQQTFQNAKLSLKEFDLKVVHRDVISQGWGYRLGGGIAARYLTVDYQGPGLKYGQEFQTPATIVQGGLESYLSRRLSLGADLAWKSALIEDTPDRTVYEVVLRLAGHF